MCELTIISLLIRQLLLLLENLWNNYNMWINSKVLIESIPLSIVLIWYEYEF